MERSTSDETHEKERCNHLDGIFIYFSLFLSVLLHRTSSQRPSDQFIFYKEQCKTPSQILLISSDGLVAFTTNHFVTNTTKIF